MRKVAHMSHRDSLACARHLTSSRRVGGGRCLENWARCARKKTFPPERAPACGCSAHPAGKRGGKDTHRRGAAHTRVSACFEAADAADRELSRRRASNHRGRYAAGNASHCGSDFATVRHGESGVRCSRRSSGVAVELVVAMVARGGDRVASRVAARSSAFAERIAAQAAASAPHVLAATAALRAPARHLEPQRRAVPLQPSIAIA